MVNAIVCGVDRSEGARRAFHFALDLASRLCLRLVLAHVAEPDLAADTPVPSAALAAHERSLEAARYVLADLTVSERLGEEAQLRAEVGDPREVLPRIAEQEDAELIVLGSRGRGPVRAALLGSVSAGVAVSASCPVAVVPTSPRAPGAAETTTIVCGLDDSEDARAALQVAAMLSGRLDARLVLAHVAPVPHLPGAPTEPGAREQLGQLELERAEALLATLADEARVETHAELRAVVGAPAPALAMIAEQERAYLVVVGCRGRSPLKAAILGSVSQELIRLSPCPVVIAPRSLAAQVRARREADTTGARS